MICVIVSAMVITEKVLKVFEINVKTSIHNSHENKNFEF